MYRNRIKALSAILLSLGIFAVSACQNETEEEPAITTQTYAETQQTIVSKTLPKAEDETTAFTSTAENGAVIGGETTTAFEAVDVEDATAETTIASDVPYLYEEPTVQFDELHDYLVGETQCVGRRGLLFTLDSISTDETGYTTVKYTLTSDGKEYKGEGGRYADGTVDQFRQDEFSPNVTLLNWCEDIDGLSYASISVSSEITVPEAFSLSGNEGDIVEITKPEYIETEDFILFLCEGAVVEGDLLEDVSRIVEIVETETGFKLNNDSKYARTRAMEHLGSFAEVFRNVDYRMQKFHIYVVPYEVSSPCAFGSEVVVNPMDVEPNGDCSTLVHELTHAVHLRNGLDLGRIMTEGYATYITDRIIEKYPELKSDFNAKMNYSGLNYEISAENAEQLLSRSDFEDDFDNYLLGFRFLHFLNAEYGGDIFNTILKTATDNADLYEMFLSNEKAMGYVKDCTGEDVFVRFAEWYSENRGTFEVF